MGRFSGSKAGDKIKLDIGCGKKKHEGCIGIDHSEKSDADIIWDLNQGMPPQISDDSVDEVYAFHFLEHVKDVDFVLKEIHRVCRDGAKVHIKVPNGGNPRLAFENPHHINVFVRTSFDYYCDGVQDFPRLFRVLKHPNILYSIPIVRELPQFWELTFELEVVK